MKTVKISLLAIVVIIVAIFVTISVRAQTADEIINKSIDAIGGRELISKIKSIHVEREVEISSATGNATGSDTVNRVVGKCFKNEIELFYTNSPKQKIIMCVTDTNGWTINTTTGNSSAKPMSKEQYNVYKDNLQLGTLINCEANGSKMELIGKDILNGASVYKLKWTDRFNDKWELYIDVTTYYLVKTIINRHTGETDIYTSSDFRKTDFGFIVPFTTTLSSPQMNATRTVKKVVINQPIDPKIFEKPNNIFPEKAIHQF